MMWVMDVGGVGDVGDVGDNVGESGDVGNIGNIGNVGDLSDIGRIDYVQLSPPLTSCFCTFFLTGVSFWNLQIGLVCDWSID